MRKFNLNDVNSCKEVSAEKLNKINGGHYIIVKNYNSCNGTLLSTYKQYANNCRCNTYDCTVKIWWK